VEQFKIKQWIDKLRQRLHELHHTCTNAKKEIKRIQQVLGSISKIAQQVSFS
jgi:hypothetical protein